MSLKKEEGFEMIEEDDRGELPTEAWRSEEWSEVLKALLQAQANTRVVKQDGANPFHKSRYSTLAESWSTCKKPLHDAGLVLFHRLIADSRGDIMRTVVAHAESGQWISSEYRLLLANQTAQGQGSAITYGRRYSLQALLSMVTGEEDDDGESTMNRPTWGKSGVPPKNKAPERPAVPRKEVAPTPSTQEKQPEAKGQARATVALDGYQDWDQHLARSLIVSVAMGLPKWTIMNNPRRKLVIARMREEGVTTAQEFWDLVEKAMLPFDLSVTEGWSPGGKSLETFVRVPQRGAPDHFTKAKEGHYRKKAAEGDTPKGPSALDRALEGGDDE